MSCYRPGRMLPANLEGTACRRDKGADNEYKTCERSICSDHISIRKWCMSHRDSKVNCLSRQVRIPILSPLASFISYQTLAMSLAPGERLAHFTILSLIGK